MTGRGADFRLRRPELAAIYRLLDPEGTYLGDPPERWHVDSLIRGIRTRIGPPAFWAQVRREQSAAAVERAIPNTLGMAAARRMYDDMTGGSDD